MKKLVYAIVLIALSTAYFLFWPEFRYEITCADTTGAQLQGCSASDPRYDFSEVRLRAGLSWLDNQSICIKTATDCEPLSPGAASDERYGNPVPMPLVLMTSIALAALSTYGIALFGRKLARK